MENLNNVPSSGTYGGAINEVNHNFSLVKGAIDGLEGRTIRSKGLFPTVAALNAAYPSPIVGDYAYVGSGLPAEIYDCVTAGTWHDTGQTGGSETINLGDYSTTTQMNAAIDSGLQGQVGYAVCSTAGATKRKDVVVSGFKLLANGGALHIKMTTANTNASATMNISPTSTVIAANTKPLFYNGEQATAENTWEANEILSIYYDGTNYQATNSKGGGGKAEKIKYNNSQSGLDATDAQGAIDEIVNKMPKLYESKGYNTDGAMSQSAVSEMSEITKLIRTANFASSGSDKQSYTLSTGFPPDFYIVEVDTPLADGVILQTLRLRNGTNNSQITDIRNIPFDGFTHKYYVTTGYYTTRILLWKFNRTGSYGAVTVRIYNRIADYSRLDSIAYDVSAYNNMAKFTLSEAIVAIPEEKRQFGMTIKFVSSNDNLYYVYQYKGGDISNIENESYWQLLECTQADIPYDVSSHNSNTVYTITSAIRDIPSDIQQVGMMIKFINPNKDYSIYKYIGRTLSNFGDVTFWKPVLGTQEELDGVLVINARNWSWGEYKIIANENSSNFGVAVSQSATVWGSTFIPCEGYDYLYVDLYPHSSLYDTGCVFYDVDKQPIHGYGSMAFEAASSNYNSSTGYFYDAPVQIEIPQNAVYFRTTYRNNRYPYLALINGDKKVHSSHGWSTQPYTGERIDLTPTYNMRLSRYMYFNYQVLDSHQGGCVWGDYFFLFGTNNSFCVLDMKKSRGAKQNPIQGNIVIPGMVVTSNIHNDSPFFTNRYYDASDEFPLLLYGGGSSINGGTYFFVLRIVKNVDESTGAITFTPTVVQTIRVLGDSWMTPYYDLDRGVICSSLGGRTIVTNKTVSATAGDFTLDLSDKTNIIQEFPNFVHSSGTYFNGKLFGVWDNDGSPLFLILDLYTGRFQKFRIPRYSEPEGVIMWKNDIYIYYVSWLGKVFFE